MQCRVVLCPMKCYCAHNLLECKDAIYLRTKGTGHKIWERQEVFPISKQLSFDKTIRIVGCSREEICRVENLMPVNQPFFPLGIKNDLCIDLGLGPAICHQFC